MAYKGEKGGIKDMGCKGEKGESKTWYKGEKGGIKDMVLRGRRGESKT